MDFFLGLFITKVANASLDSFIAKVDNLIINPLISLLFGLAVAYFLYGVFEFIANQDVEEKKTTGKSHMLWGIVGMTIMMGVWFLLGVIIDTLDIKGVDPQQGTVDLPDYNP